MKDELRAVFSVLTFVGICGFVIHLHELELISERVGVVTEVLSCWYLYWKI